MNTSFIDIYCERLGPGLWAEPLNAVTNIAFFIAAVFVIIHARKHSAMDWRTGILIVLLLSIGTGSALFHTFATYATMMMDVIPILLYQIAFILLFARGVMQLSWLKAGGLFVLFMVASMLADRIPAHYMNGSLSYAPALMFLFGFGLWSYKNVVQEKYILLLASGVFVLSLTFRTIDMDVCENIAIGTHFLWHCLNGLVLYLTTRAYIGMRNN